MSRVQRRAVPPVFVFTPRWSDASAARTVAIGEVGESAATVARISWYVGEEMARTAWYVGVAGAASAAGAS